MLKLPEAAGDLEATVRRVQAWALEHFVYVPDLDRWMSNLAPNGDHWETEAELLADLETRGQVHGDCDAYAMLCWIVLRKHGIPSRLVLCAVEDGGYHLVCEAGGWILDNRTAFASTRDEAEGRGYRWISMSGFEPGGQWTAVAGTGSAGEARAKPPK